MNFSFRDLFKVRSRSYDHSLSLTQMKHETYSTQMKQDFSVSFFLTGHTSLKVTDAMMARKVRSGLL